MICLKYALFLRFCLFVYVEHLLGWESAYLSDDLRIEKEGIYSKYREYKTNNCHKRDFHLAKDASKASFQRIRRPIRALVRMGVYISMPRLKN